MINGHALPQHLGGYLPLRYEITDWLDAQRQRAGRGGGFPLEQRAAGRLARGPKSIDYLEPGGIFRPVRLRAVPPVFISDVFAKPVKVLDADRRIEVTCTIDAGAVPAKPRKSKWN